MYAYRFARLALAVVLSGVFLAVAAGCRQTLPASHWQETAPGISVGELTLEHDAQRLRIVAVRIDPVRNRVRVVDARRGNAGAFAEEICPQTGAAVNASFFGEDGVPLGLLIADGKLLQQHYRRKGWGAFRIRDDRPEIVPAVAARPRGVTQALESKPRLIVDGQVQHFKPQGAARRSAVGIDAQGQVVFAATGDYLTLEAWADTLREEFGCVEALNLDGGSSTQLAVRGGVDMAVPGGAAVPIFLTATPRE